MAEAKMTQIVKRIRTWVDVNETGVQVNLTLQEAQTLSALFAKIGGEPSKSPRGWINNIASALRSAGVKDYSQTPEYKVLSGSMQFSNYTDSANFPGSEACEW